MHILSKKNILVTGGCGLIGSAVVELLLRNYDDTNVYVLSRREENVKKRFDGYIQNPHFHVLIGDVNDALVCDVTFHFIINAASNANPSAYASDPVGTFWTNINGTKNLLEYGKIHGCERFLYVSSGEVYGEGCGFWKEDDSGYVNTMTMRSCYPTSKRASETLCVAFAKQYGLDIVVARPCHVYGGHFTASDNRAYAQFIRKAKNGENIILKSKGEQQRSWLYVDDCANAILTILTKGSTCEAYNVADENNCITIKEFAETIAAFAGVKVVYELPDNTEKQGFTPIKTATFSTKKIQTLGWKPQFNIKDAIREIINN